MFTDDDLKRMKKDIAEADNSWDGWPSFSVVEMTALLARLEAAEALAGETKSEHLRYVEFVYRNPSKHLKEECRICLGRDVWREAAGK